MTPDTTAPSDESKTWARTLMDGVRAVQALHHAIPLWQIDGLEDLGSWRDKAQALEYDDEVTEENLSYFMVCEECARIESRLAREDGYEVSLWPCQTATALGIDDHPLL